MSFVVLAPPPALAPFIAQLWHFEAPPGGLPHARERVLPTGTMQLLVNLHEDELRTYHGDDHAEVRRTRGAAIGGASAGPFAIDTAEQRAILGVSFKPGGAYPFFKPPADALSEQDVELDQLWGRDGAVLRERLLEQTGPHARLRVLAGLLRERLLGPPADRAIDLAIAALERDVPVGVIGDRLNLSPRKLIDRFAARVGLTPKRFARVRRFQRVVATMASGAAPPWAELAVACGYFDQAHFIRDFKAFSGLHPTAYTPTGPDAHNHVVLD